TKKIIGKHLFRREKCIQVIPYGGSKIMMTVYDWSKILMTVYDWSKILMTVYDCSKILMTGFIPRNLLKIFTP
ncbi:hypothetical protein NP570_23475, partial [Vibrio parahaemolyticus]|nr:hypothetical protein [Vibrio parahaemolyticus]